MLAFELIGFVFLVLFFGAMVTDNPRTSGH